MSTEISHLGVSKKKDYSKKKSSVGTLLHHALSQPSDDSLQPTALVSEERLRDRMSVKLKRRDSKDSLVSFGNFTLTTSQSMGTFSSRKSYFSSEQGEISKERTMREMIADIATRAKQNLPPPPYVPNIDDLTEKSFSWDGKRPITPLKHSVNIIGCHHPVELILARADKRSRKLQNTLKMRAQNCEDEKNRVDALIKEKFSRAEKHAEMVELKQKQILWMKILFLTNFIDRLQPLFKSQLGTQDKQFRGPGSAEKIAFFIQGRKRKIRTMKLASFVRGIKACRMAVRMGIRVWRKRLATEKIKTFLQQFHGRERMATVVHRFLMNVRKSQRHGRAFIACKNARIAALMRLWDRLEMRYVRKRLKEKKESRALDKTSSFSALDIDSKTRTEIEKQASKWDHIDAKMEESIGKHRLMGNLGQDRVDSVLRHCLPESVKIRLITTIVERKRKEYLLKRQETQSVRAVNKSEFSVEDALQLLRGSKSLTPTMGVVPQQILSERKAELADPFLLFTHANKICMMSIVKAHEEAKTFL